MSKFSTRFYDYSGEKANLTLELAAGTNLAEAGTLQAAIAAVTRGTMDDALLVDEQVAVVGSQALPSDPDAQREDKWVVYFLDAVAPYNGRLSIPCADRTLLAQGSENLDIAGGVGAALVAEIENSVVSKYGNPITVTGIKYVAVAI